MPPALSRRTPTLLGLLLLLAAQLSAALPPAAAAGARAAISEHKLANGMTVVVIPDRRVGIVTHMVWYKVGGADDPPGKSGLAHLLEHMMFKATRTRAPGELGRIVARLGGQDNATTTHDVTFYYQRIARDRLETVMTLEADRMTGLVLAEDDVVLERSVVREERRQTVEADPVSILSEQMMGLLHQHHPYRTPAIGWAHEILALTRADAADFYRRHYAPGNAVLIVAGDVAAEEVLALASRTYGTIPGGSPIAERRRPQNPASIAARRVVLEDQRAGAPTLIRSYLAPSHASGSPGAAEALEVLARILGGGDTGRLSRVLVEEAKVAAVAGAMYFGAERDSGRLTVLALAAPGVTPQRLEASLDTALAAVRDQGVTAEELAQAQAALEARYIYEDDNQQTLARRYGEGVSAGRSVADIAATPARIAAITRADVARIAGEVLDARRSVTGLLVQPAPARPANETPTTQPPSPQPGAR